LLPLHQVVNSLRLPLGLFLVGCKLVDKELFSNKNPLFVNNIVELSVFRIEHFIVLFVFLVIFIFVVDVFFSLVCIDALGTVLGVSICLAVGVAVQLF
jgi:hypothetical protein